MADINRYCEWSLKFGSTESPFEPGSLSAGNDARTEELQSGRKLRSELIQVIGKKPFIRASLTDPSLLTTWTAITSGGSIASVSGIWRAYESNGGLGAGYKSLVINQGIAIPVRLQAAANRHATLDALFIAAFSAGTGITFGTTTSAGATMAKAFYPTSVTVGGTALNNVMSIEHNWAYQAQDDEQLEPAYYFYDKAAESGQATVKDLAGVTSARLEDRSTESVVLVFTNANSTSETVTVTLGNCKINAEINSDAATISWNRLNA